MKRTLAFGALVGLLVIAMDLPELRAQQRADGSELKQYYRDLPFSMSEVKLPGIPDRTVSILEYGAVGDGLMMNTDAFARAIRACAEGGGGKVVVPAGIWMTGPIRLESKTELHLERGALILFSKKFEDFPVVRDAQEGSSRFRCTPPLSAADAEDIAITGPGIVDGSGEAWRPVKKEKLTESQWRDLLKSGGAVSGDGKIWWPSEGALKGEGLLGKLGRGKDLTAKDFEPAREYLRSNLVELVRCKRILLDGPTFQNSPRFTVNPIQCEDIVICNVKILNPWYAQNGDGLDLTACRRVLVVHSTLSVGDDAICMKPGKIAKYQAPGPACAQIVIDGCTVYRGHGGFVIGSEGYGGAQDIVVRNCTFVGTDVGLRFKSSRGRGGLIEKIFVDGVRMKDIADEAILFDTGYGEGSTESNLSRTTAADEPQPVDARTPRFRNFTIRNVVCQGAGRAISFLGLPEMPVSGIHMAGIVITAERGGVLARVEDIELKDFTIVVEKGPVLDLRDARGVSLERGTAPQGTGQFLSVSGKRSANIQLLRTDLSGVKEPVRLGAEVPPEAVTRR
jgi:polygalacturonase